MPEIFWKKPVLRKYAHKPRETNNGVESSKKANNFTQMGRIYQKWDVATSIETQHQE